MNQKNIQRNTRQDIRNRLRQQRQQLPEEFRQHAAKQVCQQLSTLNIFQQAQHIGLYLAQENELDTTPIIELSWQLKKHCYLPVINSEENPGNNKQLHFYAYHQQDILLTNRFNIQEPNTEATTCMPLTQLDLLLLPLVGFDPQGNRLGRGAGYYDRTLASLISLKKPRLIALAYEMQKVEQLPVESWDVPMDIIITENNIYNL